MGITATLTVNDSVLHNRCDQVRHPEWDARLGTPILSQLVYRASCLLLLVLSMFVAIQAQVAASSPAASR